MAHILDTDIKFLPGIGPKRAELLGKELGIFTFRDMLYFFPFRYIDRSKVYTIRELQPTMAYIQVRGKIVSTSTAGDSPRSKRFTAIRKTKGDGNCFYRALGYSYLESLLGKSREILK